MRSISGVPLTEINGSGFTSGSTALSRAKNNNTGTDISWYTEVFSDRVLINALLTIIGKNLDSLAAFGNGISMGGGSAKEGYSTGNLRSCPRLPLR